MMLAALVTATSSASASSSWQLVDEYNTSHPVCHPQRGTNDLAIDLNGTWSTPINIGASGLPAGVSVAGTPVVPQPDPQDYTLDAEGYVALAVPSGHQAMQPHQPAVNTTPAIAPRARSRR